MSDSTSTLEFLLGRHDYVESVRRRAEARARLERLQAPVRRASTLDVQAAVEQLDEIQRLPPVRTARIAQLDGQPALVVGLHALVVADEQCNRLIGPLTFSLVGEFSGVRFDAPSGPPHPHVFSHGGACLGHAAGPVAGALAQGDLVSAVFLIIGWARQVNPRDSAAPLSRWTPTALSVGWYA